MSKAKHYNDGGPLDDRMKYVCMHCGAYRLLSAYSNGRFSATRKDRCLECGSTFLEPYTDAAKNQDLERGTHVKATRQVESHRQRRRRR